MGNSALFTNTTGQINTAVGNNALYSNTTGNSNTAIGENALYNAVLGIENVAIGKNAGANSCKVTGANLNTFLGSYTDFDVPSNAYAQSTAIGYNAKITRSNQIVLGTYGQTVSIPGSIQLSSTFVTPTAGQLGYRLTGNNNAYPGTPIGNNISFTSSYLFNLPVGVWNIIGETCFSVANNNTSITLQTHCISTIPDDINIGYSVGYVSYAATTHNAGYFVKQVNAIVHVTTATSYYLTSAFTYGGTGITYSSDSRSLTRFYAVRIA
jgi:hypothetical protein